MNCPWFHQHIPKPPAPILWNDRLGAWSVCGYQDVLAILKDQRFSAAAANAILPDNAAPYSFKDPSAAQEELIQSIQKQRDNLRQQLINTVEEYCLKLPSQNSFDAQKDLIVPCCQQLAFQLIGATATPSEAAILLKYTHSVFVDSNAQQATIELSKYFLKIIAQNQAKPQEGFLNTLLQSGQAPAVLLSPIIQMFVGLATSLPLLLGNALLVLLTNPLAKEKYLKHPASTVGELLRFAGPAQVVYRLALDKVQIGQHWFERGDRIALLLAQANFDDACFEVAEKLDLERNAVAHLSLGKGVHSCLGAPMIRDALELIPQIILKNFPTLEPNITELQWTGSQNIKGIDTLPVVNNKTE